MFQVVSCSPHEKELINSCIYHYKIWDNQYLLTCYMYSYVYGRVLADI